MTEPRSTDDGIVVHDRDTTTRIRAWGRSSFRIQHRRGPIATTEMAGYLLTCSEGTIGELAHLLTAAALAAIESGEEAINQRTLRIADYGGPSERRRQFEGELA